MTISRSGRGSTMLALLLAAGVAQAQPAPSADRPPTTADVIAGSKASDWRRPAPEDTLYLDLPGGRVVIELASAFAPAHTDNLRALAREHYWDGLAILRSQDNYVVQWGDPNAGEDSARAFTQAKTKLPAEFVRKAANLPFTLLADGDIYAPEAGWSGGFPAARDPASGTAWMAHCYAMVGAGRDMAADSSNGAELYVVIGHAPRHLDRNITLVGRVLQGMEVLSVLPRGSGALGFYEKAEQRVPIASIRLASDLPESDRVNIEVFRTDTAAFERLVEARRHRREDWFLDPVGHVELCNVPIPVRVAATK
ncbi:MAG: peptidylprolyl isomerase [Chiayiivirga sp.]|jgi:peptidylprolyl isomerase|uniref:peptidylprolyl isomerase n=1 Tax=Chiayiivirga sp. TaxID=2041042 RepID=UPI0025C2481F|nr:peptidylprolyl isomerase [Chiayiivirga sp.]MCI1710270.1 peptidylprolyl isomerase [Chiayiivirga sp.]MCI1728938.1 peptidylprolyl isomerase [Chiayiivirga sp.]